MAPSGEDGMTLGHFAVDTAVSQKAKAYLKKP